MKTGNCAQIHADHAEGLVLIPNYPCYANFLPNWLVPSYAWGEAVATSASRFAILETNHLFWPHPEQPAACWLTSSPSHRSACYMLKGVDDFFLCFFCSELLTHQNLRFSPKGQEGVGLCDLLQGQLRQLPSANHAPCVWLGQMKLRILRIAGEFLWWWLPSSK